jgi:hypothetical protein
VSYNIANKKYTDVLGCADGYTCTGFENDEGEGSGKKLIFDGICGEEKCFGQPDPDNTDDDGTRRVTICHRTCSENNPWVRITIDDDAWGGDGASQCQGGHQREHDVLQDCNLEVKDASAWGPPYKDYLIRFHGTRDSVADAHPEWKGTDEKDYWKYWERACPAVRGDACCDASLGECCGHGTDEPSEVPTASPVTPAPVTPAPVTTAPITTAPVTTAPITTAPVTPGPQATPAAASVETIPLCTGEMPNTSDTVCPGTMGIVSLVSTHGGVPEPAPPIIFDISFDEADPKIPHVSFKVDNPFEADADIYVRYHTSAGHVAGAFTPDCEKQLAVPGCHMAASTISAACFAPSGHPTAFSIVTIYLVSADSSLATITGDAKVDECCEQEPNLLALPVIGYTYKINCGCPTMSRQLLRGGPANNKEVQ